MSAFDESKTSLTLDNIQRWAREKFPDAFAALPSLDKLSFVDIDDVQFGRAIHRSLGRSAHKKLLIVGAHAPDSKVEDSEICAHIHTEEGLVSFYRIDELDNGDFELQTIKTTGAIAFHPPFSDIGDDTGNGKAITSVEAIISFYFLAAGALSRRAAGSRMEENVRIAPSLPNMLERDPEELQRVLLLRA